MYCSLQQNYASSLGIDGASMTRGEMASAVEVAGGSLGAFVYSCSQLEIRSAVIYLHHVEYVLLSGSRRLDIAYGAKKTLLGLADKGFSVAGKISSKAGVGQGIGLKNMASNVNSSRL